jgi:hypothetical protein
MEFSKIIKRELELGDAIMKKNSNIWAELGYVAGLKDGEDIGLKKGEDIGLKMGEDIGLKKGEKVGFEEGVQFEQQHEDTAQNEAVKRMREKIAAKMLKKGINPSDISEFTGLSIAEVLELKKRVENGS